MDGPAPTTARRAHCIIWHARGSPPPEKLRQAIAARQLHESMVDEPFGALATLCRAVRAGGKEPAVMLIVEPSGLPGPGAMKRMIDRYAPGASVWIYEEAASPQLRAMSAEDAGRWEEVVATGTTGPDRVPAAARPTGPVLAFEGQPVAEPEPKPVRPSIRRTNLGRPRLRLSGQGELPASDDFPTDSVHVREPGGTRGPGESVPTRAILTDAELAMLLADGPMPNEQ